ncbi:hypothetical protein F2Q68_00031191 [Brassica cretica]|uniref:Uncharacterized protein n=1 Tax=Brassica cretica TaxID=69181 RepID=A0A8S9G485_BRACR|nr:hypothetical protein F2Q68_00031191 [Brassica cretica]
MVLTSWGASCWGQNRSRRNQCVKVRKNRHERFTKNKSSKNIYFYEDSCGENTFTKNRRKTRTRLPRSNQRTSWSLRSDRERARLGRYVATELSPKLGRYVGVKNGYDEVNIQISAKYEYVFPQQIMLGQENVATPVTDRSEYDDRNPDEPSSVITQLPHMHAVRSLRSDRAKNARNRSRKANTSQSTMKENASSHGKIYATPQAKTKPLQHRKTSSSPRTFQARNAAYERITNLQPRETSQTPEDLFFDEISFLDKNTFLEDQTVIRTNIFSKHILREDSKR